MRKGIIFFELLLIIAILPFVFILFDGLFKAIVSEIPTSVRLVQENTVLLGILWEIQKDIDQAEDLPKSYAGQTANDQLLLIKHSEGVICYKLKDGKVFRQKLTDTQQEKQQEPRVWLIPHVNIELKVLERNGKGYAVEANTHLEYKRRGQWIKKMAHSHLYFAGALGKDLR